LATAASAGLCAAAALLPPPAHLLVLVALVPWLAALDRARSAGQALLAGAALAVAFEVAALGWFADAMAEFTESPRPVAWLLLAVGGPLLQPQLPLAALARFAAGARGPARTARLRAGAAFALTWVAAEWAVPRLLGDTLGQALQPSPALRQAADLLGAAGLTLLVLVANELALALARAAARRALREVAAPAAALAALLAAWGGYGALRLAELRRAPAAPAITVGVIQSNIVRYDRLAREVGRYAVVREVLDVHQGLSRALARRAGLDLLVWPETVYPTTFGAPRSEDGAALDREIEAFAVEAGVPLAFGAYDGDADAEYNAAFFLEPSPAGLRRARYRKAYLFPLTEWTPGVLGGAALRRVLPWTGRWTPGPGPQVVALRVRGRALRVGPLLCYDAVHPGLAAAEARAGAELLLAMSNDAWFTRGPGARLHLRAAALRAVETRLPLVRAAPSGISALVSPAGEIEAASRVDERVALALEVAPGAALASPYLWAGRWLGPVALAAALLLVLPGPRARTVTRQPSVPWYGKSPRAGTGRTSNPSAAQTDSAAASRRGSSKSGTQATRRSPRVSRTPLV
jgi:apolipoprotein N-acyltransferase